MDIKIRNKIIEEYKKGKGSTTIEKDLKISKPTILKVLKEEGIIRKRDRCSTLKIIEKDGFYYIDRNCPNCKKIIHTKSKDKTIACRNHINKLKKGSLCKNCGFELQKGTNNSFYGKKHTDETKLKISENRKGKALGEKNPMSKKKWRNKAIRNLKKKWKSGDLEETRKKMSETLKETRRNGKIKSVIVSKKEFEIKEKIEALGFFVLSSYRIDSKICDLYIPSLNLIIEYFGDYWHCNPKKYEKNYFNKKKNKFAWEVWEYDKNKLELIKSYGYNFIVVWESEIKHNNKKIETIIKNYVKSPISTP